VVDHSTHNPKIKGSNPAASSGRVPLGPGEGKILKKSCLHLSLSISMYNSSKFSTMALGKMLFCDKHSSLLCRIIENDKK
jgi:hypothetical protein